MLRVLVALLQLVRTNGRVCEKSMQILACSGAWKWLSDDTEFSDYTDCGVVDQSKINAVGSVHSVVRGMLSTSCPVR